MAEGRARLTFEAGGEHVNAPLPAPGDAPACAANGDAPAPSRSTSTPTASQTPGLAVACMPLPAPSRGGLASSSTAVVGSAARAARPIVVDGSPGGMHTALVAPGVSTSGALSRLERPSALAVATAQTQALNPYASRAQREAAVGTIEVSTLAAAPDARPSYEVWKSTAALHQYFWLCVRCRVVNGNQELRCHRCQDTRDAILGTTSSQEMEAMDANTQRIAYGRNVVRTRPLSPQAAAGCFFVGRAR